ncbi:MAG: class I SAM-dependent methyltransferase [Alphaproteobacteria bacterium]|nr:class I SAM-dependent methyltransferase [Alphaproteobacteria bacterium]
MEAREYQRLHEVEQRMWWFRGLRANLLALARRDGASGNGAVLDAGCGTGGVLADLVACGIEDAFGLDVAEPACQMARARSGRPVVAGSLNTLPFRDGAFRLIVSADVLCHAKVDEGAALREMRRCLAPGGRLLLNLPAYGWLMSDHDRRVQNARRYTRAEALALVRQAGFDRARGYYWNSLLLPLMVVRRLLRRGGGAESDVRTFPAFLDRLFGGALALERRLDFPFPFGGSILILAEQA